MDIKNFVSAAGPLGVLGLKITRDGELIADWLAEEECRRNI